VGYLEFGDKIGRRARVWIDDLPVRAHVSKERHGKHTSLPVALRPFYESGSRSRSYSPSGGRSITACWAVSINRLGEKGWRLSSRSIVPERRYVDSLARSLDSAVIGGLAEYPSAICAACSK